MTKEKPKVFLVGGFPAAGKSSLTKMGNDCLNADVICLDDIYADMMKEDFLWRNDSRIADRAHEMAKESLSKGRNVMLDSVYMDRESRAHTIRALGDSADVYMIDVDMPIEICKERNQMREHPVEGWMYDKLQQSAKEPVPSEGFAGIYRFDNLTPRETAEVISGKKFPPTPMTDADKKQAIDDARSFLQRVAKDSGVSAGVSASKGREIPEKFEALLQADQTPDKDWDFEYR